MDPMDIDDVFGAFDSDATAAAVLPPIPLPMPTSASKRKRAVSPPVSQEAAALVVDAPPPVKRARRESEAGFGDDDATTNGHGGRHIDDLAPEPVVLDEFTTETEQIIGVVGGTGALEGMAGGAAGAIPGAVGASGEVKFTKANVSTRHEVVIPHDYDRSRFVPIHDYVPPPQAEWCRQYPFTLDPFQEYSIWCIQRNESVLVAAHTSAGKTVVAEYAIAQALKNKQRVIYTSPIKALSNQKYRELDAEFGDVGLMTGDTTINPNASCLVMTTEILRSMLYRGASILREISWVVYDEIHYMRDKERGVVWEETLILLPPTVHFAFLSATIPNAKQFAAWIAKIHHQPCHVVYTDYRPTPLQHYVFPQGAKGISLVVDEKGTFREDNFQTAMAQLASSDDSAGGSGVGGGKDKGGGASAGGAVKKNRGQTSKTDVLRVVNMIMKKDYHPVIVFSFAKKEVESLAMALSGLDFNSDDEKALVNTVFNNAVDVLSEEDRNLPQITNILPLLRRGVGVHHSGLLPILKEVIEILFQEGLLKALFATETFSIGLNMPAKTVVFTKIEKFDGKESRHLTGGEYIQMSGRAGRRGLDDKGIVIMMVDQKIDSEKAKSMVKGVSDALYSAFRLGYNMILNLTRVEGISPEYLIRGSFRQFQNNAMLPQLLQHATELEDLYTSMEVEDEALVRSYYEAKYTLEAYGREVRKVVTHPQHAMAYLPTGRLVRVRLADDRDFGWGLVLGTAKTKALKQAEADGKNMADDATNYVVDVAVLASPASVSTAVNVIKLLGVEPYELQADDATGFQSILDAELVVAEVPLTDIEAIATIRVNVGSTTTARQARASADMRKTLQRLLAGTHDRLAKMAAKAGGGGGGGLPARRLAPPVIDPVNEMGITEPKFVELMAKVTRCTQAVTSHPLASDPRLDTLYAEYQRKLDVSEQIKAVRRKIAACEAVAQLDELKARKRVLRRLGFTDERDVVKLKGRVACEISTGDTLLLTELLFQGTFNDLTVEQCVALLSVVTFVDRVTAKAKGGPVKQREELARPLQALHETHKRVVQVSKEALLQIDEAEMLEMYKGDLMDVAYAWACGASFAQICKMTDVFEGNLVRNFRMLEELLKQMTAAARAMGNNDLVVKFTDGAAKIKRDIVFANSLYL
ncbi:rRNA-processing arch domain-containing protein [Blastocladiella britannica]|nr:rRNA-processing arch domain-containing protein [Blastocladiella britannica]